MAEGNDIFNTLKTDVMRSLVPGAHSNSEIIEAIAELMTRHLGRFSPVRVYWYGIMGVAECEGNFFLIDKGPVIFEECGTQSPSFVSLFGELDRQTPKIRALRIEQMGFRVV
jgi:hypothetical protein